MRAITAGLVSLLICLPAQAQDAPGQHVRLGDDSGAFPNDGECDDPRFEGEGMFGTGQPDHAWRDASDCRAAFDAGELTLRPLDALVAERLFEGVYDAIQFGDNTGRFARDGECDDPRFRGPGVSRIAGAEHEGQDAADCQAAWTAGRAWPALHGVNPLAPRMGGVDFGDNLGEFPNDGLCDDPRFEGPALSDAILLETDIGHDAHDCLRAWLDGEITLKEDASPEP